MNLAPGRSLGKEEEEDREVEDEGPGKEESNGSRSILYLLVPTGSFPSATASTHSLMVEVSSLASLCPPAQTDKPPCSRSCKGEAGVRGGVYQRPCAWRHW